MTQYGNNVTNYGYNNNTSYIVEFNPNNGRLTMSNEEKSWMLLGEHNNYSFSDASKMEIIYDESNKKWYLQKKGVKMQAGNTWQIRSQMLNMEVTPQNTEGLSKRMLPTKAIYRKPNRQLRDTLVFQRTDSLRNSHKE